MNLDGRNFFMSFSGEEYLQINFFLISDENFMKGLLSDLLYHLTQIADQNEG